MCRNMSGCEFRAWIDTIRDALSPDFTEQSSRIEIERERKKERKKERERERERQTETDRDKQTGKQAV